jgi:CheY-like chemotaxis protein
VRGIPELVNPMTAHNFPDFNLPPLVIVDDCEDDIFLLRHRLRDGGITNPVEAFESPAAALAYLRSATITGHRPALVFSDIKMPDGGGFELIRKIREEPEWDDMKVVVITSSNDPKDLERALRLRIDGYLIKFPSSELLAEFLQHGPWFALPRRAKALANALSA